MWASASAADHARLFDVIMDFMHFHGLLNFVATLVTPLFISWLDLLAGWCWLASSAACCGPYAMDSYSAWLLRCLGWLAKFGWIIGPGCSSWLADLLGWLTQARNPGLGACRESHPTPHNISQIHKAIFQNNNFKFQNNGILILSGCWHDWRHHRRRCNC